MQDILGRYLRAEAQNNPSARMVQLLAERGVLSAAEIVQLSGLAKSTVSTALAALRSEKLVVEARDPETRDDARVGRPRVKLSLNPRAGTCIGVQFFWKQIRLCVADVSHAILLEDTCTVGLDVEPADAVAAAREMIADAFDRLNLPIDSIVGLGIAFPGPVLSEPGVALRSSVLPGWAGVNVADLFRKELNIPVICANEGNCATLAEFTWGAGKGYDSLVCLKVDLGIGGGIVIDGRLHTGISGGAGEFGHVSLDRNGPLCRCGNRGCLELVGSFVPALKLASERAGREMDATEFIELVRSGDPGCERLARDLGRVVGEGLATVAAILNPPLIVIGGRGVHLGAPFFGPLREAFADNVHLKARDLPPERQTQIVPAAFPDNGPPLGAIAMLLKHVWKPVD